MRRAVEGCCVPGMQVLLRWGFADWAYDGHDATLFPRRWTWQKGGRALSFLIGSAQRCAWPVKKEGRQLAALFLLGTDRHGVTYIPHHAERRDMSERRFPAALVSQLGRRCETK